MALIEHKRLILNDRKVGGSYFTDDGYTTFNLDCFVPSWREDGTVKKICKRYGCKMKVDSEELRALHGSQLIQAILAIYAWIEFKECGL